MLKQKPENVGVIPLKMVGSTVFGRYPKISVEQTWNMIESDGFLVPYAGYKQELILSDLGVGRGIFTSVRLGNMIVVVDNEVYRINQALTATLVGTIDSFTGDVFIDENDNNQIAICDKQNIYIYDYVASTFGIASTPPGSSLDFTPGYVAFQDGYLIAPAIGSPVGFSQWRLSNPNDGLTWPAAPNNIGGFQTKPDTPQACIRFPSKGNLLFVMGSTVTEPWFDVGNFPFPYQRSSQNNIDYGCLNPATIASGDTFVVWLGANEKSGPVILVSTGGDAIPISTEGLNFKFANLNHPEISYGFLFKQDGHLFYQITFPDPTDNLTYTYDFTNKKFYTLCDENYNAHIAKRVTFYNNKYYFISFIDGNLYQLSSDFTYYDYGLDENSIPLIYQIPRIRIVPTLRFQDSTPAIWQNLNFVIEQGEPVSMPQSYLVAHPEALSMRVDLSISIDGGSTFGNYVSQELNPAGIRKNLLRFWNLGYANEMTMQFRFYGFGRFVFGNGEVKAYQ
jgi:hypothetical protein